MDSDIYTVELEHPSSDGATTLRGMLWTSNAYGEREGDGPERPLAIIQLTHGMAEHIRRYDDFARYLVGRGFVVAGQDMVGHGDSINSEDDYGHISLEGGKDILLDDMQSLRDMLVERFPGVPYVLYGHSMGSFMTRCYLARRPQGVACAVLCGTGNVAPGLSRLGSFLAHSIANFKGERYRSSFIDSLGVGSYSSKIKNARTPMDWISHDDAVVDAYLADPHCGFMFTVGGYSALMALTEECAQPECSQNYSLDLPLFFVAGAEDPVGDCGEGVKAAAELARKPRAMYNATAAPVDVKLYPDMRHEIHNEIGHEQVYADIADWIEAQL